MFKRLFSSSPSRPAPPDPTPKWKDEVVKLESITSTLKSAFPSIVIPSTGATTLTTTTTTPSLTLLPSTSTTEFISSGQSDHQQVDAITKLMFMLENDSTGEGFETRVKPLALAVCKQYEETKKTVTENVCVKLEENAKSLREQMESISVAFSDAHELKFTKEELEAANKRNEGLQNEIDTARQTVMELMAKIAKLNPKVAKDLKEQQQQQQQQQAVDPSASSPSPLRNSSSQKEFETASVGNQVNYPMFFSISNDEAGSPQSNNIVLNNQFPEDLTNCDADQLRQKLADIHYLLEETRVALNESRTVKSALASSAVSNVVALARTSSDVQKWKDLVEEERKTLETLRNSHLQIEQQLRSRHEEELSNLKKQNAEALAESDKKWAAKIADLMRKSLFQKEEAHRARIENEEMQERAMYLNPIHIRAHVSDARFRLQVAEGVAKRATDQRNEFEERVREVEKEKEKLSHELAENTRAMMILQAGSAEPSPIKSPASRSRFSL